MFWRYQIVILLVGVYSSRIFTSSAEQIDQGVDRRTLELSNDELLETIVSQLKNKAAREGTEVSGNFAQDSPAKKDDTKPASQAKHEELNLEEKENAKEAASTSVPADLEREAKNAQAPVIQHAAPGKTAALKHQPHDDEDSSHLLSKDDTKFAIFVGAGLAAGFIGIMLAGVCYYKYRRSTKAASDIGYPAYGVTGPMKEKIPSPGDRKLAQSAQMYHYQHQKQQMIAMEKANGDMKHDASEDESEEDNVEGDYTVYECPGLAPTGEMEVKNPLFCGEEASNPPAHAHPEYASPVNYEGEGEVEGRHSPSSPTQGHRNQ